MELLATFKKNKKKDPSLVKEIRSLKKTFARLV